MFTDEKQSPFFPFGGECMNSTSVNASDRAIFWKSLKEMHANTAEMPVYWETIEPEEGKFDFSIVDTLLTEARQNGMRLILLWFATWKNGMMKYCPTWVKRQPDRFLRCMAHDGALITNLSAGCPANLEADKNAFCRLMEYLHTHDHDGTVIAMQVENEAGMIGRVLRDYQPCSAAQFQAGVPASIMHGLETSDCALSRAWADSGRPTGNWEQVFGDMASEYFSAWQVASYIDAITEAGKKVHYIPCFTNVWMDNVGFDMPGLDYPLGGAVSKVLDLWKWVTPNIDMICPDIYIRNKGKYDQVCEWYSRPDNPLMVPESDCRRGYENEVNMFSAIGAYRAVGYFAFGTEHIMNADGSLCPSYRGFVGSFRALAAIAPLLARMRGTDGIRTIRQADYTQEGVMHLNGYTLRLLYAYDRTDLWHNQLPYKDTARGLVIQTSEDEFYFVGTGYTALLIPRHPSIPFENRVLERCIDYECVEEGYFNSEGEWIRTRIRTGDESDSGIWVHDDIGCVRVKLCL